MNWLLAKISKWVQINILICLSTFSNFIFIITWMPRNGPNMDNPLMKFFFVWSYIKWWTHSGFGQYKPPDCASLLVIDEVKATHVLKRAWQGPSWEGCPNWKMSWGHDKRVMFLSHNLMTFSNLDILPLNALAMVFSEQVLFLL